MKANRELQKQRRAKQRTPQRESNRQRVASRRANESSEQNTRRLQAQNGANTRRRQQRAAVVEERRRQKQQYLHNRGWANPETPPFHEQEWVSGRNSLPFTALRKISDTYAARYAKKHGRSPTKVCPSRTTPAPGASATKRLRVDCSRLTTTWILEQCLQNYRTSPK